MQEPAEYVSDEL